LGHRSDCDSGLRSKRFHFTFCYILRSKRFQKTISTSSIQIRCPTQISDRKLFLPEKWCPQQPRPPGGDVEALLGCAVRSGEFRFPFLRQAGARPPSPMAAVPSGAALRLSPGQGVPSNHSERSVVGILQVAEFPNTVKAN
jgi:hypothetical protein